MPQYDYRCRACGATRTLFLTRDEVDELRAAGQPACVECGAAPMGRRYSLQVAPVEHEVFDLTTQRPTTSRKHHDHLKRVSEQHYLRTGYETNVQPVDLRDAAACGIDGETKDRLRKEYRDSGRRPPPALAGTTD